MLRLPNNQLHKIKRNRQANEIVQQTKLLFDLINVSFKIK